MRPSISTLTIVSAVAVWAGLPGCEGHKNGHDHPGSSADHGDDGDHNGHDEEAVKVTIWTEKLELFAEYPPVTEGGEMEFLAHLTILDGFRPVENAKVTLVLEGLARAEASVDKKLRAGIFKPTLKAPAAGTYDGILVVSGEEVEDIITGFTVDVHKRDAADEHTHAHGDHDGGGISFLKEQQWQVPFDTVFAKHGMVIPKTEVPGEVTTPPSGQADVGAVVAGRIVAPRAGLPRPGQTVSSGEVLASIAPAPAAPEAHVRADLGVVEAEARVSAAKAAAARAERLINDRAISEREVEDAKRELRVAKEALQAAKRARNLYAGAASGRGQGAYKLTSPIDGVVVDVTATSGKSVRGGEQLFKIINLDELWIKARVPEQQAALIRSDQDAAFKLPGLPGWISLDLTGEDAKGSVVNVGRTVHPRSRTIDVIYALKEPDQRLRVGALVQVAIPTGQAWEGLVIPRSAILNSDGISTVYVQADGETFQERIVRIGPQSGSLAGIEAGIKVGERVVIKGANIIRLTSRAQTTPSHGHVH